MKVLQAKNLEDLSMADLCGLWGLLESFEKCRPVAPSRRHTVRVLERLNKIGIIDVPWPEERWDLPPRGYVTPMEGLAWDYIWNEVEITGLSRHIEDQLRSICEEGTFFPENAVLWRELARAECENYFEQQLSKHGFDPEWAEDLTLLPKHYSDSLSIARWKYLIWSGVRQGTMECLKSNFDPHRTRTAIRSTMASPSRLGYARDSLFQGFLPSSDTPYSLMAEAFAGYASRLRSIYWTHPPSEEAFQWWSAEEAKS